MGNGEDFMTEIYQLLKVPTSKTVGELVGEKIKGTGLPDYQVAQILGISKSTFSRLITEIEEGKIDKIDFYDVIKLCQFLGIGIEEISQFFVASLKAEQIGQLEIVRVASFLVQNFDLKGLKDIDFIDNTTDIKGIEKRITTYFHLDNIFQYNGQIGFALFSRQKRSYHDKMKDFWIASAVEQFKRINNPNEYIEQKLLALIPKIRPYTRFEKKGFHTVIQALYKIGLTVIVQPYISKTSVRGGTFVIDGKPCIVITDLGKNYATLWFALMHELYHVLKDFELLSQWNYHLTGDPQADVETLSEPMANHFACEMLFPKAKLDYIRNMISSHPVVLQYAEKNGVHPSIIYNFYCYDEKETNGNNYYPFYSKYFGSAEPALSVVKNNPYTKETENIEQAAAKHHSTLEVNN